LLAYPGLIKAFDFHSSLQTAVKNNAPSV